ncbi:MAG: cbb3-type cytochrome oxidase assembly protein CcoS [Calditrichales bacterium]|nr:MAG: cbb3-type cytochrome oxidase assembly protein CcoS [Calditrichales bacterium]
MSVMFLLILASLVVAIGFLLAFLWAVKSGQFDDRHTPKWRILTDEKKPKTDNDQKKDIIKEN